MTIFVVLTSTQEGLLPVVVRVNMTEPVVLSAADGVYIGVRDALLKVPVPLLAQVAPVAGAVIDPVRLIAALLAHTEFTEAMLTVAAGVMVITFVAATGVQVPLPALVVAVIVTVPLVISVAEGV